MSSRHGHPRPRTTVGDDGKTYVGKASALIVDHKAAVRYPALPSPLAGRQYRQDHLGNGTSAGGALSGIARRDGQQQGHAAELWGAIGAANERDDIFASMDYCPITNLDLSRRHGLQRMFNGVNEAHQSSVR